MKALLIVDVQNDFFEGGALEVPKSNRIIPVINKIIPNFELVIFTKDWHPSNHKSFASNNISKNIYEQINMNGITQILWPDHCIQNTFGSEIHSVINIPKNAFFFTKGNDPEVDSYSGFFDNRKSHSTKLSEFLKREKVNDIFICGLATDFCVKFTALDAIEEGFKTFLISDASKAVNINPDDFEKAIEEMKNKGVEIINSNYSYK